MDGHVLARSLGNFCSLARFYKSERASAVWTVLYLVDMEEEPSKNVHSVSTLEVRSVIIKDISWRESQ